MAFEIQLVIDERQGIKDLSLKTSGADREKLDAMKFYLRIRPEIMHLRRALERKLNLK